MSSTAKWRLRVAAVLVSLVTIAACTSSLVYNRLDTVARWYIGNLVTLDETQQVALRDWLSRTLIWHRDTELEKYELFLRDMAGRIAAGPDAALYPQAVQQAEAFMDQLSARVAPEAADLLLTLQPQQVDELLHNLEEDNRDELDEELERTDAERQKRRVRSLTRSLERWTGTATVEQKAIVERTVNEMLGAGLLAEDAEWFASQEAWRNALRQALTQGPEGKAQVVSLLREPQQSYTAAHQAAEAAQRRYFMDFIIKVDATLTPKQRATLSAKLTEVAQDLKQLQSTT
jgi:Family of unknown function (DUF6279)